MGKTRKEKKSDFEKVGDILPRVLADVLEKAEIPPEAIPSGVDNVFVIPVDIPRAERKKKALEAFEIIHSVRDQDD